MHRNQACRKRYKVSPRPCHFWDNPLCRLIQKLRKPLIPMALPTLAQPLLYAFQLLNKHN
ncbi:hypothetical protein D3C81_1305690 [compost metagenome]